MGWTRDEAGETARQDFWQGLVRSFDFTLVEIEAIKEFLLGSG